jgi:cardiolipin synthase
LAKWKTVMQLVAVGFLVAGAAGDTLMDRMLGSWSVFAPEAISHIGLTLLWVSALLTLYTGWDYFRAGVHHLIKEHA